MIGSIPPSTQIFLNVHVGQRVPKKTIAGYARKHPERIIRWAKELSQSGDVRGYDFQKDPLGVIRWQDVGREFASNNPLSISVSSRDDLRRFVAELLRLFKLFVEEQRGWSLLWNDDGTEKPEEAAQLALLGMARPYCRAHGVEIDREVELGRGPVDFKLSSGSGVRLLIEAKKLHNGDFWNGLELQLPSYLESDDTDEGWLLAIRYRSDGVSRTRLQDLDSRVGRLNESLGMSIDVVVVDAQRKPSASRIKRTKLKEAGAA